MDAQGPLVSVPETLNGARYRELLEDELLPHADVVYGNDRGAWTFQQDNAPCHNALPVRNWLQQEGVNVMAWPPQSPDLNPIETMWGQIKRAVGRRNFDSKQALWEAVADEWNKITMDQRIKLVESMPRRCKEVLKQNGMATKY